MNAIRAIAQQLLIALAAILLAFLVTGIVMSGLGYDPVGAYGQLISGSLGSISALSESLVKTIPLILTGLSFAMARRAGLVNLGATGQLYIGALCSTLVGVYLKGMPAALHVPLALLAGLIGGAAYGGIVSLLKNRFSANELITTIMLNEIAIAFANCLVDGPMKDMEAATLFPQSRAILATAVLPKILPGTRLHAGLFIALLGVAFYAFFLQKTKRGYEVRITGINPTAAQCAGMNVQRTQLLAMLLAGGFAGLAGGIEILSVQKRLMQSFAGSLGFDGIAVALLGNTHPLGLLLSAFLFGMMSNGSNKMQMLSNVPSAVIYLMQGLIVLFVVGRNLYTKAFWRNVSKRHGKAPAMAAKEGRA